MSAPSRGSSPFTERGVAVIMAMLTVALVAALAASVVSSFAFAVDSLSGRHDLAQARELAHGAIDWARNILADDFRREGNNHIDYLGEAWATKVPATPVDEGELSGEIEDLSGRFNLNSLIDSNGNSVPAGAENFVRLLGELAVPAQQAQQLANNLAAWEDSVPQSADSFVPALSSNAPQPPNAPLISPDELSNVPGFDAELVERLRPYVAALPTKDVSGATMMTPLNVNTASAEVLYSVMPAIGLQGARALVSERAGKFFNDIDDFKNRFRAKAGVEAPESGWALNSNFFLASGRAKFGTATTRMQVMLYRASAWPQILWQKIL
jgi:general secretion pathway protein K